MISHKVVAARSSPNRDVPLDASSTLSKNACDAGINENSRGWSAVGVLIPGTKSRGCIFSKTRERVWTGENDGVPWAGAIPIALSEVEKSTFRRRQQ